MTQHISALKQILKQLFERQQNRKTNDRMRVYVYIAEATDIKSLWIPLQADS